MLNGGLPVQFLLTEAIKIGLTFVFVFCIGCSILPTPVPPEGRTGGSG